MVIELLGGRPLAAWASHGADGIPHSNLVVEPATTTGEVHEVSVVNKPKAAAEAGRTPASPGLDVRRHALPLGAAISLAAIATVVLVRVRSPH